MDTLTSRKVRIEVDLVEGLEILNGLLGRREILRARSEFAMKHPGGAALVRSHFLEAQAINERAERAVRAALDVPEPLGGIEQYQAEDR